jgi:hypothetical protein
LFAERRDLDGKVAFLDDDAGPGALHERRLVYGLAAGIEERLEQDITAVPDRHSLAVPRQHPLPPVENEWAEDSGLRHGRNPSRSERTRQPVPACPAFPGTSLAGLWNF